MPKHPFPKALEEAVELYQYLLDSRFSSQQILVAGESVSGGLALASGQICKERNMPLPKAMTTTSVLTDLAAEGESYQKNCEVVPFFGKGTVSLDKKAYTQDYDLHNPKISPKYGDYKDFSDLLMFVGSNELIESDTLDLGLKIENATIHNFEGIFHIFPLGFNKMVSSRKAGKLIKTY
jgi:epsilon-lactone hydrolase